ncbi:hypothetical protein [Roseivivax sediminis]|uniref:Uncharacterized protein n=1 Tax=Roseivivax sediminis TaxID=936889 RepID=A0A1I1YQY4_9RHOB|nr:hypothetical protein [Roseivivax sediminis]SFE20573.1 hypothetical protein SAMN04515678_107107 [Roseivivax sediminis]
MPDPLWDTAQPGAVPVAVLPNAVVEKHFVAPTKFCATRELTEAERAGGGTDPSSGGFAFRRRIGIDEDDNDPPFMLPDPCNVLTAFFDFLPGMAYDEQGDGEYYVDYGVGLNQCEQSIAMLFVNRLSAPLSVTLDGGAAYHGTVDHFPATRSWDARHNHHRWEDAGDSWTIPAGERKNDKAGIGLVTFSWTGLAIGTAAGFTLSSDDPNLETPLWLAAQAAYGSYQGRYRSVAITDDLTGTLNDFYLAKADDIRRSCSGVALKRGQGKDAKANYTADAWLAQIDPAPTGSTRHVGLRGQSFTTQVVVVVDTDGKGAT